MKELFGIVLSVLLLSSCAAFNSLNFSKTYAEQKAGYSYIPLEPSSVKLGCKDDYDDIEKCEGITKTSLLSALPDNSVRIATRRISGKADLASPIFGADVGVEGNKYEVIIDFLNTQTINKQFVGRWYVTVPDTVKVARCYPFEHSVLSISRADEFEIWSLQARLRNNGRASISNNFPSNLRCPPGVREEFKEVNIDENEFNIPVYVGIGLRLKAEVTVLQGEINLSSLPALTAAVSSGQATGTMSVQTIGITGKAARSGLLLLNKIDETTIQNAIQVLASIKASIDSEDTVITPRIVGFHNTIGAGSQGVNLIHSLLVEDDYVMLEIDETTFAAGKIADGGAAAGL